MSRDQAFQRASEKARAKRAWRYVVLDCGEYEVASESDLDTHFIGCTQILAAFDPDGRLEVAS